MIVATLAGGSALLWPLPPTVQIEEVSLPAAARPALSPRPDSPAPRNKAAGKPAAGGAGGAGAAAKQQEAPPAVVKRFPTQNTALKRLAPPPRPGSEPVSPPIMPPPAPRPGAGLPPRPPAEHEQ